MTSIKSPEFKAAVEALFTASAEPSVRYMAEFREKARRDEAARMKYATQQGLKQGLQQGIQQGLQQGAQQGIAQVARAALRNGMPIRDIAAITGLDEAAILALEQDNSL
jgi:predicted transposase/invertase (TIGR01784 family)